MHIHLYIYIYICIYMYIYIYIYVYRVWFTYHHLFNESLHIAAAHWKQNEPSFPPDCWIAKWSQRLIALLVLAVVQHKIVVRKGGGWVTDNVHWTRHGCAALAQSVFQDCKQLLELFMHLRWIQFLFVYRHVSIHALYKLRFKKVESITYSYHGMSAFDNFRVSFSVFESFQSARVTKMRRSLAKDVLCNTM